MSSILEFKVCDSAKFEMHGGSRDEDMHNQVWSLEDQSKFSAKRRFLESQQWVILDGPNEKRVVIET